VDMHASSMPSGKRRAMKNLSEGISGKHKKSDAGNNNNSLFKRKCLPRSCARYFVIEMYQSCVRKCLASDARLLVADPESAAVERCSPHPPTLCSAAGRW
jgi:hypothetical protein